MNTIEKVIKSGIKWSALTQIIIQIIKIGQWFVLLYYISPSDFGLFAMGLLAISLPQLLLGQGFTSAIIQNKDVFTHQDLSSFHWLSVGYSIILFCLFLLGADFVAGLFEEPLLKEIIIVLSVFYIIENIGKTAYALQYRHLNFEYLAKLQVVSVLTSTAVVIILALNGYGLWSLVLSFGANTLIATIGHFFNIKFRPSLTFSLRSLHKIFAFTRNLTLAEILSYVMRHIDDFIIGYLFGKSILGVYDRAYQLVHLPLRLVANRVNSVLFPSYASQNVTNQEIRAVHLKIVRLSVYFYAAVLTGICSFAPSLVRIALKPEWSELAFLMPVLAIGGTIHAFINYNKSIFLALGKSDLQLRYALLTRGIIIASYLLGIPFGVKGVAIGYTLGSCLAFFPESIKALSLVDLKLGDFLKESKKTLLFAGLITLLLSLILESSQQNIFQLGFGIIFYMVAFSVFFWILWKKGHLNL